MALRKLAVLFLSTLCILPAYAEVNLPEPLDDPSRLVTIGGSLTEIVFALGSDELLVARDSTSTFPRQATELMDIGYMRQLSPEGILSVAPSAILALEGSGPPETLEVLARASVPLTIIPESFDRDGIIRKVLMVGSALDRSADAERLAEEISASIDKAEALTQGITQRKRVLFILSNQGGRILAAGSGTAADGIISMAGGVNVVEGYSGYKQLSEEAIIRAQPDLLLLMDRGGNLDIADDDLLAHPAISATPAGRDKAIVRMDGSYLLSFGPRTASAIRDLASAFYSEESSR